jgi:hypothetical protein
MVRWGGGPLPGGDPLPGERLYWLAIGAMKSLSVGENMSSPFYPHESVGSWQSTGLKIYSCV